MSASYDHQRIEKKWQKFWLQNQTFTAREESGGKEKSYILDMFPYPSSAGLHVGHPLGYTATDIIARFERMRGKNVLHPMGWDAFGLPAENYAIKTKVHPEKTTAESIVNFRRQIQELGFSYDWSREVNTSSPEYYRWTQWFFSFLFKNGLAYRKKAPVNWCNHCQTVLANEQVVAGRCERCKNEVVQKELAQWFFKIRDFIEDQGETVGLLNGLKKIDWPESTKIAQENWIGRSEGCNVFWKVENSAVVLPTFTTTVDTIYGVTFVVISPEHPDLLEITSSAQKDAVTAYIQASTQKTEFERMAEVKDKTGVFTGAHVLNPLNGEKISLFVADYVLMSYGTGVVMGVPAHDQRDMDFAEKYDLPLVQVITNKNGESFVYDDVDKYSVEGEIVNSGEFSGESILDGRKKITEKLKTMQMGESIIQYKLRDWLVSRQRYWGAPIPVVYDNHDDHYLLPDDELPVNLPHDVDFMPTGESPLLKSQTFHDPKDLERIEKKLHASADLPTNRHIVRRESDTMDTFVCSSWYMYRYMDPQNTKIFASKEEIKKWGPVDLYVGGAEHTVLHLLYARFFTKALHKYGYVPYDEPFLKLRHQGMILGEDGQKMSKSRGNVINPDEIVVEYGADTLRCYEMFMGPFDQKKPWAMGGVQGIKRFLDKVWNYFQSWREDYEEDMKANPEKNRVLYNEYDEEKFDMRFNKLLHQTIKKVTVDLQEFRFNTAISQLMIFINELRKEFGEHQEHPFDTQEATGLPIPYLKKFLLLLSPFAPHIAEEIWHEVLPESLEGTIAFEDWPSYEEKYLESEMVTYAVQVNGKLRGDFSISKDASREEVITMAKELATVVRYLEGTEIVKEIFVPGKIVGFVVK